MVFTRISQKGRAPSVPTPQGRNHFLSILVLVQQKAFSGRVYDSAAFLRPRDLIDESEGKD